VAISVAIRSRRWRAAGLRMSAATRTKPSNNCTKNLESKKGQDEKQGARTTTREYAIDAIILNLFLNAKERTEKRPPAMSTNMNKMEMPMTSWCL